MEQTSDKKNYSLLVLVSQIKEETQKQNSGKKDK